MFGASPFVVNLNVRHTDRGSDTHTHDFPQMLLMVEGQCRHVVNRRTQILSRGDVVCVRVADTHSFGPVSGERYTLLIISFPSEALDRLADVYFGGDMGFWGGTGSAPSVYGVGERVDSLANRMVRMAASPATVLARDSLLLQVLDLTQKNNAGTSPDTASDIPEWLRRACLEIRLAPNLREGVPAFVRIACRSPEHVARETRRYLGTSPVQIVTGARVERACHRLATEDLTVAAVASDVGIASSSHFHRVFTAATGMTPRQYRLAHRHEDVI